MIKFKAVDGAPRAASKIVARADEAIPKPLDLSPPSLTEAASAKKAPKKSKAAPVASTKR